MSSFSRLLSLSLIVPAIALAVDVGSGAPTPQIADRFVNAFYRNGFSNLVALPPLGDVKKLGTTGLIQEFSDTSKAAALKLALVLPDVNSPNVYQILGDLYPFYSGLGVAVAGYPTGDEVACPSINGIQCNYQLFSLGDALFSFKTPNTGGQNVSVDAEFYTKWMALGGLTGALGIPLSDDVVVTSSFKTTANVQPFTGGAIYSITSGTQNAQAFAVSAAVNAAYQNFGGATGFLGFPTSDETVTAAGLHRQTFEGGRFEFQAGTTPMLLAPVVSIVLSVPGPIALHVGDTIQVAVITYASGGQITGRTINYSTSNSRVATVQGSGDSVTVKAVAAGTANITATSEGKVSQPLAISVIGQCCAVGEGAPSAQTGQAFQDLVTRDRLSVLLPAANPVQRVGTGYVQDLVPASQTPGVHYYVTKSDRSAMAYLVTGDLLTAYLAMGGPAGALGFALSDASAGGTQLFENGALAGSPMRVVSGAVLAKWAALGYEAGTAGAPVGNATPFSSLSAYNGMSQAFANGTIFAITNGNRAGQGYFVSGPILARYAAVGGPGGAFGIPVSDEFSISGLRRQNFEDGYIDYSPGDTAAQEHAAPRQPAVIANPGAVVPGSRIRLSVTGFENGSTLRISVSGQPDFLVTTPNGSYDWDTFVPASALSGVISIHAANVNGPATADGSYTIRTLAQIRPQIVKLQGDGQSGAPGALLAQPLIVAVQDQSGNPIAGVTVTFQASGNAQISPVMAVTDTNGHAAASYRLPPGSGIAAATAAAGGQVATFGFQSKGSSLANFPQFVNANGLLASVAGILRFGQNRGDLPSPRGLADPTTLSQFLSSLPDGFVSAQQLVNLWRVGGFVGGGVDISVENPDLGHIRDLIAAGSPVLLNLSLTSDGAAAGGASVAAIGIADDGGILIQDANAALGRTRLNDYLAGFQAGGHTSKGTVLSAARLIPRAQSATGFLISALSQTPDAIDSFAVASMAGACGPPLDIQDAPTTVSRFVYCDGTQPLYELNSVRVRLGITDLALGGASQTVLPAAGVFGVYKVSRIGGAITVVPESVSFSSSAVVNAATFARGLAPGGLFSIFGGGFSGAGPTASVMLGGLAATVVANYPFQINAQVPPDLAPGNYTLQVQSPLGTFAQQIEVSAAAPGIFVLGGNSDGQAIGAVVNQDGRVNGPSTPARRGSVITVYCTGLGAVTPQGRLFVASSTVKAVLNGSELTPAFSGLTPGFIGLYQVNIPIPATAPPGLGQALLLREGGADSNTVNIAVQ